MLSSSFHTRLLLIVACLFVGSLFTIQSAAQDPVELEKPGGDARSSWGKKGSGARSGARSGTKPSRRKKRRALRQVRKKKKRLENRALRIERDKEVLKGALVKSTELAVEQRKHIVRVVKLKKILRLGREHRKLDLVERAQALLKAEMDRHRQVLTLFEEAAR